VEGISLLIPRYLRTQKMLRLKFAESIGSKGFTGAGMVEVPEEAKAS